MSVNQPGIKTDYVSGDRQIPAISLSQLSRWVQGMQPDDDSLILDHRPEGIGVAVNRDSRTLYRIRWDEDDEDPGYLEDKIGYIGAYLGGGVGGHWHKKATGAETIILSTGDWRRRSMEIGIVEDDPAVDSTPEPTVVKWVRCAWANVDLATSGVYTVRILAANDASNPGALVLVASAASTNHVIVWARASKQVEGICTCDEADYNAGNIVISGYSDSLFTPDAGCEDQASPVWDGSFAYIGGCQWANGPKSVNGKYMNMEISLVSSGGQYYYGMFLSGGLCGKVWLGESAPASERYDVTDAVFVRVSGNSATPSSVAVERVP